MRLASYAGPHGVSVGVLAADGTPRVWDLREVMLQVRLGRGQDPWAREQVGAATVDMIALIDEWHGRVTMLRSMLQQVERDEGSSATSPLSGRRLWHELGHVRLLAPVLRPSKIVCLGASYREHIVNIMTQRGVPLDKIEIPERPRISFMKPPSAIIGPGDPVRYPRDSAAWDCEGEIGIIIGAHCRHVPVAAALEYVFGYTIAADVCFRDLPGILGGLNAPAAKGSDTFAPMGPVLVTPDELPGGPNRMHVTLRVDGDLRQDSNTADLLWPIEAMVSEASRYMSLWPGDVLMTGSPAGTGLETGRYLREGQVVRIEAEGIGMLENPVGPPR